MGMLHHCPGFARSVGRVLLFACLVIVAVVATSFLLTLGGTGESMQFVLAGIVGLFFYLFFLRGENFDSDGDGGD